MEAYRPFVKNSKLFLNGQVTPKEAEELIIAEKIDGVMFGTRWISNPDLVKRLELGIKLDTNPSIIHYYGVREGEDWSAGYTDYPPAAY